MARASGYRLYSMMIQAAVGGMGVALESGLEGYRAAAGTLSEKRGRTTLTQL